MVLHHPFDAHLGLEGLDQRREERTAADEIVFADEVHVLVECAAEHNVRE